MITYGDLVRKMYQKQQKRRFMHKTRYGRSMEERWGYDLKSHQEEYQRVKNDPRQMIRDYLSN